MSPLLIVTFVIAAIALAMIIRAVRIVPQAEVALVERFGRFQRLLRPGLHFLVPFLDRLAHRQDMREQVVPFAAQPMITKDNVTVNVDTVFYYRVTDAYRATYEVAELMLAVEQLTVTTLRNKVGELALDEALTSREAINAGLREVLDQATQQWGIRVERVEIKAIDPPATVQSAMEKQLQAERERRAAVLTAEGAKQSQILRAEGERESAILSAEGERQSQILRAEGEKAASVLEGEGRAQAIELVFNAIKAGEPDDRLLAYEYLQKLPAVADGKATKLMFLPSGAIDAMGALTSLGAALGAGALEGRSPAGSADAGAAASATSADESPSGARITPAVVR